MSPGVYHRLGRRPRLACSADRRATTRVRPATATPRTRHGCCRATGRNRLKIALKGNISAGSRAPFGSTPRRSVRPRRFDDLTILEGIAEKGIYSAYAPFHLAISRLAVNDCLGRILPFAMLSTQIQIVNHRRARASTIAATTRSGHPRPAQILAPCATSRRAHPEHPRGPWRSLRLCHRKDSVPSPPSRGPAPADG